MFSLGLTKKFSSQNGKKTRVEKTLMKMPMCTVHMGFVHAQCFFFPPNHLHIYKFFFIYLKMCYFLFYLMGSSLYIYTNFIFPTSHFSYQPNKSFSFLHFSILTPKQKWEKTRAMFGCIFFITQFLSLVTRHSSLITHHFKIQHLFGTIT